MAGCPARSAGRVPADRDRRAGRPGLVGVSPDRPGADVVDAGLRSSGSNSPGMGRAADHWLVPMIRRATGTGRSSWPRWRIGARTARAMSARSFTANRAPCRSAAAAKTSEQPDLVRGFEPLLAQLHDVDAVREDGVQEVHEVAWTRSGVGAQVDHGSRPTGSANRTNRESRTLGQRRSKGGAGAPSIRCDTNHKMASRAMTCHAPPIRRDNCQSCNLVTAVPEGSDAPEVLPLQHSLPARFTARRDPRRLADADRACVSSEVRATCYL